MADLASDRTVRVGLLCLLVIACALRVGWGLSRPSDEAALSGLPDQVEYLELGRNLLSGEGLFFVDPRFDQQVRAFRTPGYPWLIAACGGNVIAIRLAQAVIDTLTVLAVFLLARRWLDARTSLVAAALVAVNPFLIYFSGLILSETLFIGMLAWGLVLLTRPPTSLDRFVSGLTWVTGVAVLAVSILVRPSAIGLPLVLGVAAVFANRPLHTAYHRRWPVPPGATALLLTFLVLVPWAYRNWSVTGSWIWSTTNSGFTAYDGFNPDATGASDQRFWQDMPQLQRMDEVGRSEYLSTLANQFVREHPRRAFELAWIKLGRTWSPYPLSADFARPLYVGVALVYAVPLYLLVIVGLMRGSLSGSAKVFLLLPAIYLSVIHMLSVGSLRYRIPAEVPLAVLAAGALPVLMNMIKRPSVPNAAEQPEPVRPTADE